MKIKDIENIVKDHVGISDDELPWIYDDHECNMSKIEDWYRSEFDTEEGLFNKQGYRSDSLSGDNGFLFLGCSITFGYGLPRHEAWPWIVGKHFDVSVWNLAVTGQGDDVCFLNTKKWISKLKPKVVCMMIPPTGRFKFFDVDDESLSNQFIYWKLTSYEKEVKFPWLFNVKNLYVHTLKNILSIKTLCDEHNIPLVLKSPAIQKWVSENKMSVWDKLTMKKEWGDVAQDGQHPGPKWHKKMADYYIEEINKCI